MQKGGSGPTSKLNKEVNLSDSGRDGRSEISDNSNLQGKFMADDKVTVTLQKTTHTNIYYKHIFLAMFPCQTGKCSTFLKIASVDNTS